jgi:hypothetical protein
MSAARRIDTRWAHRIATLRASPRMLELVGDCGAAARHAVVDLWAWAAQNRPDGDLGGMSALLIARAADWRRGCGPFVAALRRCGFIDDEMHLVDWHEPVSAALRVRRFRNGRGVTSVNTPIEHTRARQAVGVGAARRRESGSLLVLCSACNCPLTLAPGEAATTCARCASQPARARPLSLDEMKERVLEIVRAAPRTGIRLVDIGGQLPGQPAETIKQAISALLGGRRITRLGHDIYTLGPRADAKRGGT